MTPEQVAAKKVRDAVHLLNLACAEAAELALTVEIERHELTIVSRTGSRLMFSAIITKREEL